MSTGRGTNDGKKPSLRRDLFLYKVLLLVLFLLERI